MRHVIITRLGIGIARPSFYRQHIAMLKEGLFKSLCAQTNQNFEWYVCVDQLIDAENRAALQALLNTQKNFKLFTFDPLRKGRMMPYWKDFSKEPVSEALMLTRMDDDDCLHARFVEIMQDFACERLKTEERFSCAIANGIEVSIHEKQFRKRIDKELVGLSTVTGGGEVVDIYKGGHRGFSTQMKELGIHHHVIETAEPFWIYTIHPHSDSFPKKPNITSLHKPMDGLALTTLESCAVSADWPARIEKIFIDHPDPVHDLHAHVGLKRLNIKRLILNDVRSLQKAGDRESDRYKALVAGFYAI